MLVVLKATPVASPREAVFREDFVGEIVVVDFVFEVAGAVGVAISLRRVNAQATVLEMLHVWVVKRVEVDGFSAAVVGERFRASYVSEVEARRVISCHRFFVVGIVVVDEHHAFYWVVGVVEFAENGKQVVGNRLVAHHLAEACLTVICAVEHLQIAQVGARRCAIGLPRLAIYALEESVTDGMLGETTLQAIAFHRLFADSSARLPVFQNFRFR